MIEYQKTDDYCSYKLAQGQDQQVGTNQSDDELQKWFFFHLTPRKEEEETRGKVKSRERAITSSQKTKKKSKVKKIG